MFQREKRKIIPGHGKCISTIREIEERRKCNWGLDKVFSIVIVDGGWPAGNYGAIFGAI